MNTHETRLRNVLKSNASFSLLSGAALLIFAGPLAELTGLGSRLALYIIGAGLVVFAGTVFFEALRDEINDKQVNFIIIQDWIWVAASFAIVVSQAFGLTSAGYGLIAAVAVLVGLFAFLQGYNLKRIGQGGHTGAS